MRNRDMPAGVAGKIKVPAPKGGDPLGNYWEYAHGLTKREHFTGLAMQAIIAKDKGYTPDVLADDAVEYAEALCRRLDESNKS